MKANNCFESDGLTFCCAMFKETLMGQLDNFVRNAICSQWEKAPGTLGAR
jgi:hypothetical protein